MVISRTPLRISFCGGGSDLPSFYGHQPGAVVGTTINKYIYINANRKFDNLIRASYSITEIVEKPQDLKHELLREALLSLGITRGIEIASISDIPSQGTGLGSSSSFTVGLLHALRRYQGQRPTPEDLARQACEIEIGRCGKPIGKQDQYAAAYGGLRFYQFNQDGSVTVEPIACSQSLLFSLQENLLMLYTGLTRKADGILGQQDQATRDDPRKRQTLSRMVGLAREMKRVLEQGRLSDFGELLHQNWELKKRMTQGISSELIDRWYNTARRKGALGGKILGAGGGGFLLLYAPKEKHPAICAALPELRPMDFAFEPEGSRIIYE